MVSLEVCRRSGETSLEAMCLGSSVSGALCLEQCLRSSVSGAVSLEEFCVRTYVFLRPCHIEDDADEVRETKSASCVFGLTDARKARTRRSLLGKKSFLDKKNGYLNGCFVSSRSFCSRVWSPTYGRVGQVALARARRTLGPRRDAERRAQRGD